LGFIVNGIESNFFVVVRKFYKVIILLFIIQFIWILTSVEFQPNWMFDFGQAGER